MDLNKVLAVTFSGMRPEEEPDVMELLKACGLTTEDLTKEKLRDFILARKGEQVVGVIGLEVAGEDVLLRSLAVAEPFRNQDIGSRLVHSIERYATQHGARKIYLLTMKAKDFFSKQGYQQTERGAAPQGIQGTQEFKQLCPDTAVCMCKQFKTP